MNDYWEAIREEFPVTRKWIYFNHAGVAPIPLRTSTAIEAAAQEAATHGACLYDRWMEQVEGVRRQCAGLIGADHQEIAFVKNTSHGLSLVANGLPWKRGDNILTVEGEFPSNIYPWMNLQDRGVELRIVAPREGRVFLEDLERALDRKTRLLTISSVEFGTGFRNDLDFIGRLCREKGILFCVDAIQSLGALPMDVKRCQVDFLAADGHKWLLAPEGQGFFYCAREQLDFLRPALLGWNSVRRPRDFSHYDFTLRSDAQRFEEGTWNFFGTRALGASLELLLEIGVEKIQERVLGLTDKIVEGLQERGFAVRSPRGTGEKSGIVSFKPKKQAEAVHAALMKKGVASAARDGGLRVSPHFYNSEEEIDRFFVLLEEADKR